MRTYLKLPLLIVTVLSIAINANAQKLLQEIKNNPNKAGGVYCLYKFDNPKYTEAPEGYEPFYISHYGRHGSRWLSKERNYTYVKEKFDKAAEAGILTEKGKEIYAKVTEVFNDARYRAGTLTPLGYIQHRGIAERMAENFHEVFCDGATINASSTTYPRCIISMAAFCERLKELNPKLNTTLTSDLRATRTLNFFHKDANPELTKEFLDFVDHGKWKQEYKVMAKQYIKTGRIMHELFNDTEFISEEEATEMIKQLYYWAVNIQGTEINGKVSLYDIFTPEELYNICIYDNYYFFMLDGPSSVNKGTAEYYARVLLEDIIQKADSAIAGKGHSADLRFGHDSSIMPLVSLMQFKEFKFDRNETDPAKVIEKWDMSEITPMATNIQFILFRKGNDVLVKVMHNEHEMHLPLKAVKGVFYKWNDFKDFYSDYISSLSYPDEGIE